MTDTEKCEYCGGGGTRRYTITVPMFDTRAVFVCDACRKRFFVTTDEACEVLRKWDSERAEVDA